jgi:haloacetate dehalogenase
VVVFSLLLGCISQMCRQTCEDYRASATIDLEHDRNDRNEGRKISVPALRILWGANGMIPKFGDPVEVWKKVSDEAKVKVTGRSLACGHYIPEEKSDELLKEIVDFCN